jgi:hypothetical protein
MALDGILPGQLDVVVKLHDHAGDWRRSTSRPVF